MTYTYNLTNGLQRGRGKGEAENATMVEQVNFICRAGMEFSVVCRFMLNFSNMSNEEYLVSLDEHLNGVMRKYMRTGRVQHGRTITSMQLNIENCMNDADEIQKEMIEIATGLQQETGVEMTPELKKEVLARYIAILNKIGGYRITGEWPEEGPGN